jgi:predicted Zn-dependent protease
MNFSNSLAELDEKGTEWCGEQTKQLEAAGLI